MVKQSCLFTSSYKLISEKFTPILQNTLLLSQKSPFWSFLSINSLNTQTYIYLIITTLNGITLSSTTPLTTMGYLIMIIQYQIITLKRTSKHPLNFGDKEPKTSMLFSVFKVNTGWERGH